MNETGTDAGLPAVVSVVVDWVFQESSSPPADSAIRRPGVSTSSACHAAPRIDRLLAIPPSPLRVADREFSSSRPPHAPIVDCHQPQS